MRPREGFLFFCSEIMIYSEEEHSSPVCKASLPAVGNCLPKTEALKKYSGTNE